MVNAFLVTNLTEGLPQDVKEKYLQNMQQTAGKYNFRIAGAVIDHSDGEFPFFNEVLELLDEVISTGQCDAIILDDSYGYVMSEEKIAKVAWYAGAFSDYEAGQPGWIDLLLRGKGDCRNCFRRFCN